MIVVYPDRIGELERHVQQLALEHRCEVHAARDVAPHVLDEVAGVTWRQLVDMHAADVHRVLGRLEIEEGGVKPAQVIHGLLRWHRPRVCLERGPANRRDSPMQARWLCLGSCMGRRARRESSQPIGRFPASGHKRADPQPGLGASRPRGGGVSGGGVSAFGGTAKLPWGTGCAGTAAGGLVVRRTTRAGWPLPSLAMHCR